MSPALLGRHKGHEAVGSKSAEPDLVCVQPSQHQALVDCAEKAGILIDGLHRHDFPKPRTEAEGYTLLKSPRRGDRPWRGISRP
jgi:hypothetical protein